MSQRRRGGLIPTRRSSNIRQQLQPQRVWQSSLGVTASVSKLNLLGFLIHSSASIVSLVFLNATQPFLIAQLDRQNDENKNLNRQGSLSGTLVFADEALSMFLALLWGSLADVIGTKYVAVLGYCFIAFGLLSYTFVQNAWPDLLYCRLLFALGGSAVTTMLTGILSSYSATYNEIRSRNTISTEDFIPQTNATESTGLLNDSSQQQPRSRSEKQSHGRLAALAGLSTGFGALLAVFVLLRLPTLLAKFHDKKDLIIGIFKKSHDDKALREGTKEAFYIVAILALLVAVILSLALKMDAPSKIISERPTNPIEPNPSNGSDINIPPSSREARRQRLKSRLQNRNSSRNNILLRLLSGIQILAKGTLTGFKLAGRDTNLPLAYLGGALARASTIATTVFIPLLVTRFFYSSGICSDLSTPDLPTEELKRRCRQAFTIASILSGMIQLVALLLAPLIGYLCDTFSPSFTLFFVSFVGTISYLVMGIALPNDGDPRSAIAWVAAVGIGLSQIGVIVSSLALCAKAKARLTYVTNNDHQHESEIPNEEEGLNENVEFDQIQPKDVNQSSAGAIAGAYSATGGFSILLISKLGGFLSDLYAPGPFLLMSGLAGIVTIASFIVLVKQRYSQRRRDSNL